MEKKKIGWYEKDYLIDYRTQFRIILKLAVVTFVFTSIIILISYAWIQHLRPIFDQTIAGPKKPTEAFQIIADMLLYRLVGVMVVMFFFFIVTGIILTHRFTGPIWKLQRELNRFFDGEAIENINFRKRDEFKELPQLINKLVHGYKE